MSTLEMVLTVIVFIAFALPFFIAMAVLAAGAAALSSWGLWIVALNCVRDAYDVCRQAWAEFRRRKSEA